MTGVPLALSTPAAVADHEGRRETGRDEMDELPESTDATGQAGPVPLDDAATAEAAQHTQGLLAEHVPLTLLVDLLSPTRETSAEIMATEGLPNEEWWADPED